MDCLRWLQQGAPARKDAREASKGWKTVRLSSQANNDLGTTGNVHNIAQP